MLERKTKQLPVWKYMTRQRKVRLARALETLLDRSIRAENPSGRWDRGGRWYPDDWERQACCGRIRYPSRRYPYSLLRHCRTAKHVAFMYNVDVRFLLGEVRQVRAEGVYQPRGGVEMPPVRVRYTKKDLAALDALIDELTKAVKKL